MGGGGVDVAHAVVVVTVVVVGIVVEHDSDRVLDSIFVVGRSFHV